MTVKTTTQNEYEKSLEKRLERSERFRRLAASAAAGTIAGRPSMATTSGLVVPKGWAQTVKSPAELMKLAMAS